MRLQISKHNFNLICTGVKKFEFCKLSILEHYDLMFRSDLLSLQYIDFCDVESKYFIGRVQVLSFQILSIDSVLSNNDFFCNESERNFLIDYFTNEKFCIVIYLNNK